MSLRAMSFLGNLRRNLTFIGTGLRILGDFSNATFTSRLCFKTSTTNGDTKICGIPNGTGTGTSWQAWTKESMNDCYRGYLQVYDDGVATTFIDVGLESVGTPTTPTTTMRWRASMYGNEILSCIYGGANVNDYTLSTPFGRLKFPAAQNASSDPNTLDDYEEFNTTPADTVFKLSFATPGDLAVTYTFRQSCYTKIGRVVIWNFAIVTASFTHTTAAGNFRIEGAPFAAADINSQPFHCPVQVGGVTSTALGFVGRISAGASHLEIIGNGSSSAGLGQTNFVSGATVNVQGTITYFTST